MACGNKNNFLLPPRLR